MLMISTAVAEQLPRCGNSESAARLFALVVDDSEQRRKVIRCNNTLTLLAEQKAAKMADFGLVAHNLGGSPNVYLRENGYELPSYYGNTFNSNQVEAIAGGYSSAAEVWQAFKRSSQHRQHLLGEHPLYLEQDEIGVAFVKDVSAPHVEYWVVYLTKSGVSNNNDEQAADSTSQQSFKNSDSIPNKNIAILTQ
ncbi:CAP domain-containing protein [Thalassotalea maritima]|uniref:CAP domain-containing protein n=1 Tax=Thalassotalea maritima TaxID=3242416 RepID=UPI00352826CB